MNRRWLIGVVVTSAMSATACSQGTCPTIACQPLITLSYAAAIAGTYDVSVSVKGRRFDATCPIQPSSVPVRFTGIQSCDANGLLIGGVDLGHGANDTVAVDLAFDGGFPIRTTATLEHIANARDCDLVCYQHQGSVPN